MKQSLQLNANQQLTLSPKLQQAIKLLQLSTLELQQEIQQQVDINPLLEIAANDDIEQITEASKENDLLDLQWSHLYTPPGKTKQFNESSYSYENLYHSTTDLRDHLRWQMNLTPMTECDQLIATTIIDAIDDNGFLTLSLNELYNPLIENIKTLTFDECEVVRHRLQRFDPIGCAATGLAETLFIQLSQFPETTPNLMITKDMIQNHMQLLGEHNYPKLRKLYQISEKVLSEVLTFILHLNPRPGAMIARHSHEYITPDLIVKRDGNTWMAHLNPTILPHISINNGYASIMRETQNQADYQFIRNHLQEARFFLKNVKNRQETLLKVARYIIQFQSDFFELGEQALKPLILSDVAEALNLHESTISRITTQKYVHTPRGLFELKYFFSTHIPTKNGDWRSSTSISALIKTIIKNEDPRNPYSDSKITGILTQQGIQIARRTITKYRELMGIARSNERKEI